MIFLPKFLFILSNAPLYIPNKSFRYIDSLLTSFLWGDRAARVSLAVLQLPVGRGGLAIPDLRLYYLASQLVQAHWCMFPQLNNAATAVEAAVATSYEALLNFCFRGMVPTQDGVTVLQSAKRVLQISIKHIQDGPPRLSPNTPLWFNPRLKDLSRLEDGYRWAKFGLAYVHQLFERGEFKTFAQLKREMGVPDTWAFHYSKLRHAAHAQFGTGMVLLENTKFESMLAEPDHTKRISTYYAVLMEKTQPREKKMRERWTDIIPELTEAH